MSSYDVKHAQEIVLGVFRSFRDQLLEVSGAIAFDRKTDASPVTQWDVAIEAALQEALRQYDASIGFYGEETGVYLGTLSAIGLSTRLMGRRALFAVLITQPTWRRMLRVVKFRRQ